MFYSFSYLAIFMMTLIASVSISRARGGMTSIHFFDQHRELR